MKSDRLRLILRLAAALALVGAAGTWLATGAHRGWTKTEITEMHRDEITGIDYPVHHAGFVAGLDVLAAGSGIAVLLAAASVFAGRKRNPA